MKKAGKRLLILAIIGAVLYGAYFIFARPTGYTDKRTLVESYVANIGANTDCTEYFDPETIGYCETFSALFEGQTVTIESMTQTSQTVNVTLDVGGNTDSFAITFTSESLTGIRGIIHGQYYLIDIIE